MKNKSKSGGIPCTAIFIIFLVLKISGTIDWSWWWVTSPLWIPLTFAVVVMAFVGLMATLAVMSSK